MRPYLCLYVDAPLTFAMQRSRLWCRSGNWSFLFGVHAGPDMDPSEFVPPKQIGLDVDRDRINRPDIHLSHQRTPKVRLTVVAPLRASNFFGQNSAQLPVPSRAVSSLLELSRRGRKCLSLIHHRRQLSNLDFQMGGDTPPV